jgi:hypothetical protein
LDGLRIIDGGKMLAGTILVRNMSFQKHVSVRLTVNDWKAYEDVEAPFAGVVSLTTGPGFVGVDRFEFRIEVESLMKRYNVFPGLVTIPTSSPSLPRRASWSDGLGAQRGIQPANPRNIGNQQSPLLLKVEMAVRCEMNGQETWDNNNSHNHWVALTREVKPVLFPSSKAVELAASAAQAQGEI